MRELRWVVLAFAFVATVTSSRAADFKTGDMINQETWQKATDLLPPEILKHYEKGEYANKFVDWPADKNGQAAGVRGRQRSQRRQVHAQPRRHDHRQSDGAAAALHRRLSLPDHRPQGSDGGVQDPVELFLPHLVLLRKPLRRVADQLDVGRPASSGAQTPRRASTTTTACPRRTGRRRIRRTSSIAASSRSPRRPT